MYVFQIGISRQKCFRTAGQKFKLRVRCVAAINRWLCKPFYRILLQAVPKRHHGLVCLKISPYTQITKGFVHNHDQVGRLLLPCGNCLFFILLQYLLSSRFTIPFRLRYRMYLCIGKEINKVAIFLHTDLMIPIYRTNTIHQKSWAKHPHCHPDTYDQSDQRTTQFPNSFLRKQPTHCNNLQHRYRYRRDQAWYDLNGITPRHCHRRRNSVKIHKYDSIATKLHYEIIDPSNKDHQYSTKQ